ncbi:TAP domain protein [Arthrobacter sp. 9V]|uniref:alpha/beta fold hydrolase n=1 Tax=Arthrobacter sp. 9V TaxID=2653132 RepID=UPI0012F07F65|nr:alpha/beta hydrolase [Arthrobacter sp. 9V]VXB50572.1 TAP domain protein [Arthrobacter sp. 9V]
MKKLRTTSVAAALLTVPLMAGCAPATLPADPASGLARFHDQSIGWVACEDQELANSGTECATVTVPLDYAAPDGKTITVAISRIASTDPSQRRGILQTNPGGPGGRGLGLPAILRSGMTPEVAAAYDVIGMDTRGLGKSTPVDCGVPQMSWMRSAGADREGFDENVARAKEAADRCWEKYPDILPHINTQNIARDIDVIRAAMGESETSFLGWSYGTFLGATYSQMFPDRIDRLVLDSAPDPAKYGITMFKDMAAANEKAIDDFAAWASSRDNRYRLGSTSTEVRHGIEMLISDAATKPIPVGGHMLDDHVLPFLMYVNGVSDLQADNETFAQVLVQLRDLAHGENVELHPMLAGLVQAWFMTELGTGPDYSATLAIICGDVTMPSDPEWYWDEIQRHRRDQPIFAGVHNTITPCSFWREAPPMPITIDNAVPALQIQAVGDTRTTYEEGLGMHAAMKGSRLVTLPGRIHAVFPTYGNQCANSAVNDYLLDGKLPGRDMFCE